MPIRKHGKGYEVRVQSAGVRFSRTVGNRADAHELERTVRARFNDHQLGRTPRYSLEEALERWLTVDAAGLKSLRDLKYKLRELYPYVTGQALTDIVDVAERVKADSMGRLAPATINRRLAILRRVANLAHQVWGWLDLPLGARIKLLPGERSRHVYLTPEQVRTLAQAARQRSRDAILLAAMSGLRRAELLGLGPENRVNGALHLGETKSGRPRVVPLPPDALRIPLPLAVTDEQLRQDFERARVKIGLPHVRLHDLRHTYASWLVQSGAPLAVVRDLLGHSSIAVTDRYSHLGTHHLAAAVSKLPGLRGAGAGHRKKKKAA